MSEFVGDLEGQGDPIKFRNFFFMSIKAFVEDTTSDLLKAKSQ